MQANKLSISVSVNRKAAALRGVILDENVNVSVGPEDLSPENWELLVKNLNADMSGIAKHSRLYNLSMSGPEISDLAVMLDAFRAQTVAEQAKEKAREQETRQHYVDTLAARERALEEIRKVAQGDLVPAKVTFVWAWMSDADRERFSGLSYDGFQAPELPEFPWLSVYNLNNADSAPVKAQTATREAINNELKDRVVAANAEALEVARPQLEVAAGERDQAKAIAEALAAEQTKALYAKRLETGTWEMETPAYKSKRYSSYWCAKVTFPSGPKAVYEFGDSTGKWGEAGILSIDCAPGEIIAWGQKDLRHPGDSEHHIWVMREDGGFNVVADKVDAYKLWKANKNG
jgi:hypothetical protein